MHLRSGARAGAAARTARGGCADDAVIQVVGIAKAEMAGGNVLWLVLEALQFSIRLLDQLKANGHPTSATYIARQIHVTPHAVMQWLNGIPKEQYMQA